MWHWNCASADGDPGGGCFEDRSGETCSYARQDLNYVSLDQEVRRVDGFVGGVNGEIHGLFVPGFSSGRTCCFLCSAQMLDLAGWT